MKLASLLGLFPSFIPGSRLVDGGELLALANELFGAATGITAYAGGGQANATNLTKKYNEVTVCATNSDSVKLPLAIPGREIVIYNQSANTLAVFGKATNPNTGVGDTIAAAASTAQAATGTGVTQATAIIARYSCIVAGKWKQSLSA